MQSLYNAMFEVYLNEPCFILNCVVKGQFYKGIIQRNYKKMTTSWSFSYDPFVKFHGKHLWRAQHDCYDSIHVIMRCDIK